MERSSSRHRFGRQGGGGHLEAEALEASRAHHTRLGRLEVQFVGEQVLVLLLGRGCC